MTDDPHDERILVRKQGSVGLITLDRPRAIGALDTSMIRAIAAGLERWHADSDVDTVVLDATSERGFCAGGDIRALHEWVSRGDLDAVENFFRQEYALNAAISEHPAPIVAIADGITMGGGIGLAGHAHVRIVTETSTLAMPETRIGFTPDVGGSWLLAHAPGRLGEYLALTSATMNASDALYAGFADHFVRRENLPGVMEALRTRADPGTPGELLWLFDETPDESDLVAAREWIDDAFALDTVVDVRDRLRALAEDPRFSGAERSPAAALAALGERPPTSLAVTLAAIRSARALRSLRDALAQEFQLVMWFARTQPDMVEGIRAQMIDKDQDPRWSPARLEDLPEDIVGQAFGYEAAPLWR